MIYKPTNMSAPNPRRDIEDLIDANSPNFNQELAAELDTEEKKEAAITRLEELLAALPENFQTAQ